MQMQTTAFESELAELIVQALNLEIRPDEIDPEAPLFGEGLGLDSIDLLEIALAVSKKYGFKLPSAWKPTSSPCRTSTTTWPSTATT